MAEHNTPFLESSAIRSNRRAESPWCRSHDPAMTGIVVAGAKLTLMIPPKTRHVKALSLSFKLGKTLELNDPFMGCPGRGRDPIFSRQHPAIGSRPRYDRCHAQPAPRLTTLRLSFSLELLYGTAFADTCRFDMGMFKVIH